MVFFFIYDIILSRNGECMVEDTICAISTPVGVGGISIIRVSGKEAIKIVSSIFDGKNLASVPSHTIHYGHIVEDGKIIDEVLVTVMLAPKTYTVEDVVEINLHGGIATTNKVLELLLYKGCRLAEPGEFTKRAFLNGRIDLVKAEAVEDVIEAESENARALSVNQLTGALSNIIRKLRDGLLAIEASIEVNIDYPEYEDLEDMTLPKVKNELANLSCTIEEMLEASNSGKIIKTGINVAIIGRPNVGKSSILNGLLEEDKAIVTDIEGTTRDIVSGEIILAGTKVNFIDTAGIRDTKDEVERIGVDRSLRQLDTADLVILVLNNNEPLTGEERGLLKTIEKKKHIIFVNKSDLERKLDFKGEFVCGNTVEEGGLEALKKKICEMFSLEEISKGDFTYISNARQLALMKEAKTAIDDALAGIDKQIPVDIIESDIARAREKLSEILGEKYDEELIDELFKRFCLGK